jgi:hypothetical protein
MTASNSPAWPGADGTPDPWYDGKGMDATEASVAFGVVSESGEVGRGYGLIGQAGAQ